MKSTIRDYNWLASNIVNQGGAYDELEHLNWEIITSKYPELCKGFYDKPFLPLSESDLKLFELEWGERLPSSYRRFILEHNGGVPDPPFFLIQTESKEEFSIPYPLELLLFYGLTRSSDSENNSFSAYEIFNTAFDLGLPKYYLHIASNTLGDSILLCLIGEKKGYIFDFIHDDCLNEDGYFDENKLGFITDDFEKLINSSCTKKDYFKALKIPE